MYSACIIAKGDEVAFSLRRDIGIETILDYDFNDFYSLLRCQYRWVRYQYCWGIGWKRDIFHQWAHFLVFFRDIYMVLIIFHLSKKFSRNPFFLGMLDQTVQEVRKSETDRQFLAAPYWIRGSVSKWLYYHKD